MNQRTRYALIAAGGIFILLVGVLLGGLLKGGKSPSVVADPTPSETALTSDSPSPDPSPSPSPSPSLSPSPKPSLAPDMAASADGALLNADESGMAQSGAPDGIDCKALGDAGWAVKQCQAYTFSDKLRKAFLVEHHAPDGGGGEQWRAMVLKYSYAQSTWIKELSVIDDTGSVVSSIDAQAIDLTKDGKPEIVFGYKLTGTGKFLAYDVVTAMIGTPTVAVHRELGNGHASVANGVITDYEARYGPKGECCPVDYLQARIGFGAKGWRVQPLATVKQAPAGNLGV